MTRSDRPSVVHVAPYFAPHIGGVETTAQVIAESLSASRPVEMLTTTCGARGSPRVERHGRLTVRRVRAIEIAHTPIAPGLAVRLMRLDATTIVHVHVAQAVTPEIVWLTSKLLRRPYVAHFHLDVGPSGPLGLFLRPYKALLLARVLRGAASVIALTADQASFLVTTYKLRSDQVAVVPNGVTPGFARADEYAARSDGPLRLLFVGRLDPQKNVPLLLEAHNLMKRPAELVIAGDGAEMPRLRRILAERPSPSVRLVGEQHGEELRHLYAWADVFVLGSEREGMPLAVLEAMAYGLPIVATDASGTRELCSGVGVLTDPSPEGIAAALDSLADRPDERVRLSGLSTARAAEFGWTASLAQIEQIYAEALR